jgi:hypothetical protein
VATDAGSSSPTRLDTIVLLGSFNPLILDPHWLVQNEIIDQFDLEHVEETGNWIATRDIAAMQFRTFALQADRDRVQVAMTPEAETPLLLGDVVVNVFRLLAHTPVRAVGLNHSSHRALSEDRTAEILDRLAPQQAVEGLLPGIEVNSLNWQADRADDYAGRLLLSVQPSLQVTGLFFNLNDHFELGEAGSGQTAADLVAEEWQESLRRAEELFDRVVDLA